MKFVAAVFAAFLALAYSAPAPDETHHHVKSLGHDNLQDSIRQLAPADRRFGSGDSASAMQCAANCARQMKEKMRRDLPDDSEQVDIHKSFDAEKLNKLCRIHDSTTSCMNQCSASQVKQLLNKALGLTQYMCHDSNFRRNAPCLSQVQQQSGNRCDSRDKCGGYKQKIEAYKTRKPSSVEGLKDMMKQTCQYTKCALDCGEPAVVAKCGQSAQDDLEGIGGKTIEFLKFTVETLGLGQAYPSECNQLIH